MVSRATPVEVVDLCGSEEPSPAMSNVARLPVAAAFANQENVVNLFDDFYGNGQRMAHKRNRTDPNAIQGRFKSDPNSPSIQEVEFVREAPSRFKTDPNESPARSRTNPHQEVDLFGGSISDEIKVTQTVEPRPEYLVLEVFPDADLEHIRQMLLQLAGSVPGVLTHLAENSYPKTKQDASLRISHSTTVVRLDRKKFQHDYMSSESFAPTALYVTQSSNELLSDFPFLSKIGSQRILAKSKNHYAIAHDKIMNAIKGTQAPAGKDLEDMQYQHVLLAFSGNRLHDDQTERMDALIKYRKTTLKQPRRSNPAPLITDMTLLDEISYVKQKLEEWMDIARKLKNRKRNREVSQRDGTGVECSCCFDEVAIDDMVACRDEGHLFCQDCLKAYAENQVFGSGNLGIDKETKQPALELKCFHGDGCSSGFHRICLEKALPVKVLRKYDELQFQVSIERAGLDDVCTCPKCGFQAALDPSQRIFYCPVEDCQFESCRSCGEASHIPLRCDEVEKDQETKGRLTVEEAITNAKIRKCPKCSQGFIKSDGCNKIRCGCGAFVCYVCRAKIKDYSHFCQTPHCEHQTCRKCPLYTKSEEDDERAMREAGLTAAKQVQTESETNVDPSGKKASAVQIDVDSILKEPAK
jgi:TRIAD3 protein (E3 ubiquitin-protein ligase RNF216)